MTPSPHTEINSLTLEARIKQVEMRLIAREERLWVNGYALRDGVHQRVHQRLQKWAQLRRRLKPLAIAGGVFVTGAGVWWVLRRRRQPRATGEALRGRQPASRPGRQRSPFRARVVAAVGVLNLVPWATVLKATWPFMPAPLKRRATPGGAAATVSVALPWVAKFAAPQDTLGMLRLWFTSLNGLWEGFVGMKQRSAQAQPPAQTQPSAQAGPG